MSAAEAPASAVVVVSAVEPNANGNANANGSGPPNGNGAEAKKEKKFAKAVKQVQDKTKEDVPDNRERKVSALDQVVTTVIAANRWNKKKKRVITKLHSHFQITCGIMLGIQTTVRKFSDDNNPLTRDDFSREYKMVFPSKGSFQTPSHSLAKSFEFKDYAGRVFAAIRRLDGIDSEDYLASLGGKLPYLDFITNSKSGQFFFFTFDRKYLIKTQPKAESKFLRGFLKKYYEHLAQFPQTWLVHLYGMHRITIAGKKVHFIIMRNCFPNDKPIHQKFDLKGSLHGRLASERERRQLCPVLKDQDFQDRHMLLGQGAKDAFTRQLQADVAFLTDLKIMDYSLLLGIHYPDREKAREQEMKEQQQQWAGEQRETRERALSYTYRDKHVPEGRPSEMIDDKALLQFAEALEKATKHLNDEDEKEDALKSSIRKKTIEAENEKRASAIRFMTDAGLVTLPDGGIVAQKLPNTESAIYYMAVIDILQLYNLKKKSEHAIKSITRKASEISSVNPKLYGERFLKFIGEHIK